VCQRCGIWYNREVLTFQYDWRGSQLQNLFILVCPPCLDIPQEQLRAITLPADPVPIFYPSVEDFDQDETDYRAVSAPTVYDPVTGIPIPSTTLRVTEDCQNRSVTPFGRPVGLSPAAVMPYDGAVQKAFGVVLPLLSVIGDGSAIVAVTCYSVHGLKTNDQINVQGLSVAAACGSYSVTVVTATAFTYMTYGSIPAGNLLTSTASMLTCLVGLPRSYQQIPKLYGPPLVAPTEIDLLELETAQGFMELESGQGDIELEIGP
jgi:hypothetical protein